MALGNEVAVKNDPEDEPNKDPVEALTETEQPDTASNNEIIETSSEVNKENVEADAGQNEEFVMVEVEEAEQKEEVVEVESNEGIEDPPAEAEEVEESVPAQEEEEEDEEDLIDPMDTIREQCKAGADAVKFGQILEDCNNRVNSRSNTEEKCHEEMIDYMHAVDQCMSKKVFSELK